MWWRLSWLWLKSAVSVESEAEVLQHLGGTSMSVSGSKWFARSLMRPIACHCWVLHKWKQHWFLIIYFHRNWHKKLPCHTLESALLIHLQRNLEKNPMRNLLRKLCFWKSWSDRNGKSLSSTERDTLYLIACLWVFFYERKGASLVTMHSCWDYEVYNGWAVADDMHFFSNANHTDR